jgi:hypothetical protein
MPCGGGASWQQKSYRIRNDDGSESAATWLYALNTSGDVEMDKIVRVRLCIRNYSSGGHGGGGGGTIAFKLQAKINSGSYADISSSSACQYTNSSYITNLANTTQQISTNGSFYWVTGDTCEQLTTDSHTLDSTDETEHEWVLWLDSAQLNDGDTVTLRVLTSGGSTMDTYTTYPTMTARPPSTNLMLGFHF